MIDWEDVDFAALALPLSLASVIVMVVLIVLAARNERACAELRCPGDAGAQLLNHQCLCTSAPTPP